MTEPTPPPRLASLLDRVRGGDEAALDELLRHYEPQLRTAARLLLGPLLRPHLDTLDLVQTVHRTLLPMLREGKYELTSGRQLVELAVTVLRRKVSHVWRRARLQSEWPDEAGGDDGEAGGPPATHRPDDDPARSAESRDGLERLTRGLGDADRELLELCRQGFTPQEIAGRLGCDAHVLRSRLSKLRGRLRGRGPGPGPG